MRCRKACLLLSLLATVPIAPHRIVAGALPIASSNCGIAPAIPPVPTVAKVISATGVEDEAGAIQQAIDQLNVGEWLVFAPGVYRIGKALTVGTSGVTLYGNGATLLSTQANEGGITIRADGVAIYGFTLDQASMSRQSAPWSGGIAIYDDENHKIRRVRGSIVQKNVVNNAAAAGIFVYSADDFLIAQNIVWRSLADGVHVTAGSARGRIIGNEVSQTGDDMIAVVSYAGSAAVATASERYKDWGALQGGLNQDIFISGNRVKDQYWGRGISVVGGANVTITHNVVSGTPYAAGIYLVRETSFRSFGVHQVIVRDNDITAIETGIPAFRRGESPASPTGHGAIEIASLQDADEWQSAIYRKAFSIADVQISDNKISQTRFAAIRGGVGAPSTVSRVSITGNSLTDVGGDSIVEMHAGLEAATIRCRDNTLNGTRWTDRCEADQPPSAAKSFLQKGALLECSRDGALIK